MASTSGESYWANFRDQLTGLAIDYGRAKLVDVERADDDRNIPDNADLRYTLFGSTSAKGNKVQPGLPIAGWLLIGGAALLGVYLLKKAL